MGNRYLQMDVETVRPEVLISRLFNKAIASTELARLEHGEPRQRVDALRRSLDIVSELRNSLDFTVGGEAGLEIAQNLDLLYEFVADRLIAASIEKDDRSIDDVVRVLEPLAEGWSTLASGPPVELPEATA